MFWFVIVMFVTVAKFTFKVFINFKKRVMPMQISVFHITVYNLLTSRMYILSCSLSLTNLAFIVQPKSSGLHMLSIMMSSKFSSWS